METTEKFKKLGYFWLPSTPDKKVPGTLSISDEGIVKLEAIGEFVDDRIATLFDALRKRPNSTEEIEYTERIVGYIEHDSEYIKNDGRVTLDDCYLTGHHLQSQEPAYNLYKLSIFAERAFIHVEYDKDESPCFNRFFFL